ncbi:hypothetical protein GWE18_07460 [Bradyrhizobium sp. CSA112]|uniref:hypothetical protein n=1 Tax=Bradyrhizobium sp. CSA112 TaxID=2699170 RepID=UPI0023B0098E|nr:hypothetical protein [Bradyrhizobium sp. CSA112]MDE5452711.1 hypothetical protein [Bradyrhizobium sp. CSA112]
MPDGGLIRVCESCLEEDRIDWRLASHAQELEDSARALRSLIGRLRTPTYEQWRAEVERVEDRNAAEYRAYEERWRAKQDKIERLANEVVDRGHADQATIAAARQCGVDACKAERKRSEVPIERRGPQFTALAIAWVNGWKEEDGPQQPVKIEPVFEIATESYFGGCPICGKSSGFLNTGRSHWFFCHDHQTKWVIGSNLFSCWHEETEDDWNRNSKRLANYDEVKPILPDRSS